MNRTAFSVAFVGLGAVVGLFVSLGLAEPTTVVRAPDAEKLTALRMERREVLRQAVKEAEEAYNSGVIPYTSIPRITINLLSAELDLASNRAARIAIREGAVDQSKEIERLAAERVKAGIADATELLEARAARLQAEIDLLREGADGK